MIPDPTYLDEGTGELSREAAAEATGKLAPPAPAAERHRPAPLPELTDEEMEVLDWDLPPVLHHPPVKFVRTIFYDAGRHKPLPLPELDD